MAATTAIDVAIFETLDAEIVPSRSPEYAESRRPHPAALSMVAGFGGNGWRIDSDGVQGQRRQGRAYTIWPRTIGLWAGRTEQEDPGEQEAGVRRLPTGRVINAAGG